MSGSEVRSAHPFCLCPRQEPNTYEVGPCQASTCHELILFLPSHSRVVRRTAAGVKVERPTGRTTLTPARTGAGCCDEKTRKNKRSWSHTHLFGLPNGRSA
jgi:hypothetical protein